MKRFNQVDIVADEKMDKLVKKVNRKLDEGWEVSSEPFYGVGKEENKIGILIAKRG